MRSHNKGLWCLAFLGAGIVVVVIVTYVFYFHSYPIGGHSEWAAFGEYVGGTSNSFLSLLTFLGVLYTISLTYSQLESQKEQHEEVRAAQRKHENKEDIYRVIQTVYSEIKEIMNTEVTIVGNQFGAKLPLYKVVEWSSCPARDNTVTQNESIFCSLHDLLFQLKFYLTTYDTIVGDDLTSNCYKRYLSTYVNNLNNLGKIAPELLPYYNAFTIFT